MIKRLLIYFIFLTGLLFFIRHLHYYGLLKQQKGYYAKYKTAFLEKNAFDVVFLGSSRVEMHYNTRVFDSLTGRNSFNLSLAGATPIVAFAALKAYLYQSNSPEYLIYEIDYHFLKYPSCEVKEFNNYFPFLSNKSLRKNFNLIDSRINHFYYNPYFSLPYTGFRNLSTSLHGWLNIANKTDSLFYKGYLKEVLRPQLDFIPTKAQYSYFNPMERNYLDSIIILCKVKKIHITLLSSPLFAGGKLDVSNKPAIISHLKSIAAINKIDYFDLSSLPFCNDRTLFVDHFHMNFYGAVKFTEYLSKLYHNKLRLKTLK